MSDASDRRKYPRLNVNIPARVYPKSDPSKAIDASILDLSEGGAFVHCSAPIRLGEEIIIEISFSETRSIDGKVIQVNSFLKDLPSSEIHEKSVVKWARGSSNTGFGVEFVNRPKEKKQFLQRVIQYFGAVARAAAAE
jgi:hypothetical protein